MDPILPGPVPLRTRPGGPVTAIAGLVLLLSTSARGDAAKLGAASAGPAALVTATNPVTRPTMERSLKPATTTAAAAGSVVAAAVPPDARQESLSPEAAVARALARSDAIRRAELAVEVAQVEASAWSLASPELQLGHRSVQALGSQVDPFDDTQVGIAWQPPALDDFGLRQAIGRRDADAGHRAVDEVAVAVAVEVRTLHAQVLALQAERALAQARAALLERLVRLQERRVTEKVGTALDVELTALDLLDARAEIADLDGDLARLAQRLARLLGEQALPPLAEPTTPLCALPSEGLDVVLVQARSRSPRLRALDLREQALDLRETRSWLRLVPWVDRLQVAAIAQADGRTDVRARLDIAVPLFAPLSPERRLLSLEREVLAAERRAAERDVDERLRSAWDRLAGFATLVAVHAASADRLQGGEEAVGRALDAEVVDVLRVVAVQQRVLNARRQAVRSRARCDEAAVAFAAAAGRVLLHDVEEGRQPLP
jgi:outer membrane protein TolC